MNLEEDDCGYNVTGNGKCSHLANGDATSKGGLEVQVAPLEKLLACLGRSTVDFWSLDVEGVEGKILATFPFKDIEVGVLLIEVNKSPENKKEIEQTMETNGFQLCGSTG